jgi:hypothetical protein
VRIIDKHQDRLALRRGGEQAVRAGVHGEWFCDWLRPNRESTCERRRLRVRDLGQQPQKRMKKLSERGVRQL